MLKKDMANVINAVYDEVLNKFNIESVPKYFDSQYNQITDNTRSNYNEFICHLKMLKKVVKHVFIKEFKEKMFDETNSKVFLHYIVDITKLDGKVSHVEVFAVFTFNNSKIVKCEELTQSLDDDELHDIGRIK
ncbi:hypothetical protein [Leuconostoc palmae]|uniref:hypothetical protein n=1 Tax=Leuconostoc palmae TaxID=501487 RepID=UPI001C7E181D|nr:hypothetical protein [Leuconostoc palmae]